MPGAVAGDGDHVADRPLDLGVTILFERRRQDRDQLRARASRDEDAEPEAEPALVGGVQLVEIRHRAWGFAVVALLAEGGRRYADWWCAEPRVGVDQLELLVLGHV